MMRNYLLLIIVTCFFWSCNGNGKGPETVDNNNPAPPAISYNVVKVYPHDTASYTEGLVWQNNTLYESTGNTPR